MQKTRTTNKTNGSKDGTEHGLYAEIINGIPKHGAKT
jgi:hypothetical protein